MRSRILIAPSILAANQNALEREAKRAEKAGADLLHLDVMDGRFVPRITYGVDTVRKLRKATKLPLDVHLMIAEPWKAVEAYAKAGAKRICVHVETGSAKQLLQTLKLIKKRGCKAGLALTPGTPVAAVDPALLKACDFVMPMSVVPGFSGQEFMNGVVPKMLDLQRLLKKLKLKREIEADGGINAQTAPIVAAGGVTVLVAGAAVFNAFDARTAIKEMRRAAEKAR